MNVNHLNCRIIDDLFRDYDVNSGDMAELKRHAERLCQLTENEASLNTDFGYEPSEIPQRSLVVIQNSVNYSARGNFIAAWLECYDAIDYHKDRGEEMTAEDIFLLSIGYSALSAAMKNI
jgi:hypothetical protein